MCTNGGTARDGEDPGLPVRDLAGAPPSAELVGALARIDPAELSADDRVWLAQGWERVQHWAAAQSARVIATVVSTMPQTPGYLDEDPDRSAAAELSLALRLTENGARCDWTPPAHCRPAWPRPGTPWPAARSPTGT